MAHLWEHISSEISQHGSEHVRENGRDYVKELKEVDMKENNVEFRKKYDEVCRYYRNSEQNIKDILKKYPELPCHWIHSPATLEGMNMPPADADQLLYHGIVEEAVENVDFMWLYDMKRMFKKCLKFQIQNY